MRLSAALMALAATSVSLSLAKPARGENPKTPNHLESRDTRLARDRVVNSIYLNRSHDRQPDSRLKTIEAFKIELPSAKQQSESELIKTQIEQKLSQLEVPDPNQKQPSLPTPTTPENTTPDTPKPTESTPSQEPRVLVGEVAVNGADEELSKLVYETITTEPGRTTTRSQLQEDVNAVYATGLFSNVEVTPEDTPLGVRITFSVQPNPILNSLEIETLPSGDSKRILPQKVVDRIFKDRYGKILNLRDLQADIKQLNKWYTDNGYDLAQVVGSPAISPDGVVTLRVAEGVIENIQVRFFNEEDESVKGRTRDFIVTREIQLKSGDIFNSKIARKDVQRVFGLGIFEDAKLSFSPGKDPSKVVVNVDVVESSTGSIGAGAGFSSSSGLFGQVSYQQKNLGGNNQTLATEVQIGTEQKELLFDVSFTDPWIAGDPYRTSYTINGFRRRSISLVFDGNDDDIQTEDGSDSPRIVRTGGGVNFTRPLAKNPFTKGDWKLTGGFQYERVQVENDDGEIAQISEQGTRLSFSDSGEDDLFTFKFGATRDRRNDPLQPTKGSLFRLGLDQTVPIGSGAILLTRLRSSYSYYVPVKFINFTEGPQALAFNFQGGTILGDLPPYEAFIVGGSNSVRGYAEGEVGSGRSYVQATAEYRFPIFSVVGGALFLDYGTTLGSDGAVPGSPSRIRNLPGNGFSYGVGVRVQSPLGPIRIDYGINDEGGNRIQFGIGERF